VLGLHDLVEAIRAAGVTGAVVDPFAAYLLVRARRCARMERHNANAQALAEFLVGHPRIAAVHYAGLHTHPQHDIAQKQMRASGRGLLRGEGRPRRGLAHGRRPPHPVHRGVLGGAESFIEQPAIMSFYELTTEERLEIGIKDNLIRYAVGIEDADDLIADVAQALDRAFAGA
jgi:cystathionine gamma-synthase